MAVTGFGQAADATLRLMKLATILRRQTPVTFAELSERHGLYDDVGETSRRQFERDKDRLRDSGVQLVTVTSDSGTPGYRAAASTFASVIWTPAELDTLAVLSTAVGNEGGGIALAKLAAGSGEFPADQSSASIALDLEVPDAVGAALRDHRRLTFTYRNARDGVSTRTVEPWDLHYRGGLLYLVAWDPDDDVRKNFRIDRIEGTPVTGPPATTDRPDDILGPVYPDDRADMELEVPPSLRHDVVTYGGAVHGQRGQRLTVTFADARPWVVLGWAMRSGSTVLAPPELARRHQEQVAALVEIHRGAPTTVSVPRTRRPRRATLTPERLQRLLALPTWLGERSGATLEDIATAFNCDPAELDADLAMLEDVDIPGTPGVGLLTRHGDQFVYDRWVEEASVDLTYEDVLRLQLMLTVGASVLPASEAPGIAAIAARLRAVVPASLQVELTGGEHPDLAAIRTAITEGQVVRFQYKGRRDHNWNTREVRPERLVVDNGAIYVFGVDVIKGEERMFRLDRLSDVEVEDPLISLAAETARPAYVATAEEIEVVLRLTTRATWILTQVSPVAAARTDDGGAVAVIRTDTTDWLLAHVRAAAGDAEVISPPEVRAAVNWYDRLPS